MNTELLRKKVKAEYTPEEAAILLRLRVFVTMRWLAVLAIVVATLVVSTVLHIGFPTLPVYIICAFIALYNLVLLWQSRRLKTIDPDLVIPRARTYSNIHILLDLITLTVLLHFTGGIENPLIFFLVFYVITASLLLPYRRAYLLATAAMVMVSLLVGLEYAEVIPHVNLSGFVLPTRYKDISRILAVLGTLAGLLAATTYMATAVSGELRKRQRQVVALREQLLEEKTRELEKSTKEIAKLEEEKEKFLRFISIAAHDLKAPLTAIQGFLWVILGGYVGDISDKQKDMLQRSTRRINELLNLISDLLDVPRIETGQIVSEMKMISLREVIKGSLDEQRNLAQEKGVKLKVEMPLRLPKIYGSAPRLQQVMTNLVSNAINYTREGAINVRVIEHGNDIEVSVADTGIGIPPEDLPRVFEDFFRASNVESKGTGMGLSITKRIVEAHGGKIWVESPCPKSNTGSKFTCTLPKRAKRR